MTTFAVLDPMLPVGINKASLMSRSDGETQSIGRRRIFWSFQRLLREAKRPKEHKNKVSKITKVRQNAGNYGKSRSDD